ncbi:ATP-binding protein [Lactobacillus intestinalis]|uniref:ATP-binding protein n=1 Tax=Lactobacillus intestinalis TaxID=151781 RepID=UPI00338D3B39
MIISNTYAEGKNIDYSKFFDRFYREDKSHNNKKSGFGIGLSMARDLVHTFKGKIKVEYHGDMISFIISLKTLK